LFDFFGFFFFFFFWFVVSSVCVSVSRTGEVEPEEFMDDGGGRTISSLRFSGVRSSMLLAVMTSTCKTDCRTPDKSATIGA